MEQNYTAGGCPLFPSALASDFTFLCLSFFIYRTDSIVIIRPVFWWSLQGLHRPMHVRVLNSSELQCAKHVHCHGLFLAVWPYYFIYSHVFLAFSWLCLFPMFACWTDGSNMLWVFIASSEQMKSVSPSVIRFFSSYSFEDSRENTVESPLWVHWLVQATW